jgi:hypothetical protein
VETSADACPATGEAPADGHWTVFAFDDCELVTRQDPSFPEELCHSSP